MEDAEVDQIRNAYENGDLSAIHRVTSAAIRRNPNDWQAHYHQGHALRFESKFGEAAESQQRALQALQSASIPDNSCLATVYLALGIAYQLDDKLDEAAAALKEGTRCAPDNSALWNSLGLTERKRNNFTTAIEAYENGLDIELRHATDEARSKGLWSVGKNEDGGDTVYFADNGFGNAVHGALQRRGLFTKLLANRARVHLLIGQREEAILGFVRAATLANDPAEAIDALDELGVVPNEGTVQRAMERNADVFARYVVHRAIEETSS
jgi:tetratricopeptide (TPR) repeat protein